MNDLLLVSQGYNTDDSVTKYCHKIADYLAAKGIDTHLVCFGSDRDEKMGNLNVHEVGFKLHGDNYFSWSMLVQSELTRKVREIVENNNISIIHANDWFTVPASLISTKLFRKPLLVTYHSIENERGMDKPHSGQISEIEWEGATAASYVIVHNKRTSEALDPFNLPQEKVKVLDQNEWLDKLFGIYKQIYDIKKNEKKEVETNENFNAYMGVSSS